MNTIQQALAGAAHEELVCASGLFVPSDFGAHYFDILASDDGGSQPVLVEVLSDGVRFTRFRCTVEQAIQIARIIRGESADGEIECRI